MRCINCGADNPPSFIFCIQNNQCAACGGEIMNGATQELLKELTDAMDRMPHDPAGVAGWLLSNYRFQKVGEAVPVDKFHRKGSGPASSEVDSAGLKIAPSYSEFVKRSDATEYVAKSNELAAKFNNVKNSKMAELATMIQGIGDNYGDNTIPDNSVQAEAEDQSAYLEMKQSGFDPFATVPAVAAGPMNDLYQAINPKDVANLLKQQSPDAPLEDEIRLAQTEKGRAILQMNELKKLKAQEAISGGGGGVFRRS